MFVWSKDIGYTQSGVCLVVIGFYTSAIQHYLIKFSVTCADRWFSPGTPVFTTNKTDCHDATEILLKVALNTIRLTLYQCQLTLFSLFFSSECTTGRYGINCESHCHTCVNRICSRHDGSCKYGCIESFKGDGCHSLGIHIFTNINTKNNNIDMF